MDTEPDYSDLQKLDRYAFQNLKKYRQFYHALAVRYGVDVVETAITSYHTGSMW